MSKVSLRNMEYVININGEPSDLTLADITGFEIDSIGQIIYFNDKPYRLMGVGWRNHSESYKIDYDLYKVV